MPDVTIVGTSTTASGTSTAPSVAVPSGVAVNDVIIIVMATNADLDSTDNNGGFDFTKDLYDTFTSSGTGLAVLIWSWKVTTTTPTTYDFTIPSSDRWAMVCVALRSADLSASGATYDLAPNTPTENISTSSPVSGTRTTGTDGSMAFAWVVVDTTSITISGAPGGSWVDQGRVSPQSTGVATQVMTTAGATGNATWTLSGAASTQSGQFAVKAAAAGGGVLRSLRTLLGIGR